MPGGPGSGCRFIHGRGAEAKRNWGPGRSPAPALQLDLFCYGSGHRGACAQLYTRAAGGRAGGMMIWWPAFLYPRRWASKGARASPRSLPPPRRRRPMSCHLRGCAARCRRPSSRASTPRVPEPEPSASCAAPKVRCAASFSPPTQRMQAAIPPPDACPSAGAACRPLATARVHHES